MPERRWDCRRGTTKVNEIDHFYFIKETNPKYNDKPKETVSAKLHVHMRKYLAVFGHKITSRSVQG